METINIEMLASFEKHLIESEKAAATICKYLRDLKKLAAWLDGRAPCRGLILEYKAMLCKSYAPASVNSTLTSLNVFFDFIGRGELKVRMLKIQKQTFSSEKQLTSAEYDRLLAVAKGKSRRLWLLMQTICSTGIRVSELRSITVEAVMCGVADVNCKGKRRQVFLPHKLCRMLISYIREAKIKSGCVFVTKNSNPLDRSNIWSEMKALCAEAGVADAKVFPHNLRHLFARTYYNRHKDIVRLADLLGHSSINTTRIYTKDSGATCRRQIQSLGLLRC